ATRQTTTFGRDLGFTKVTIVEAGVSLQPVRGTVLNLAAYEKRRPSDVVVRFVQLPDPRQPFSTRNVYGMNDFWVYGNADLGAVRGVDAIFEGRIAKVVAGAVAYTYQRSTSPDSASRQSLGGWITLTPPQGVF